VVKFIKYGPKYSNKCTDRVDDFLLNFKDIFLDDCGSWEIEVVEMTEEEFCALPEFSGF